MEIWSVQIPIYNVVTGGATLLAAAGLVSERIFRRFLRHRIKGRVTAFRNEYNTNRAKLNRLRGQSAGLAIALREAQTQFEDIIGRAGSSPVDAEVKENIERFVEASSEVADELGSEQRSLVETVEHEDSALTTLERDSERVRVILAALNWATTILVLMPVVGAVVALVSEHTALAIVLDAVGLIVLVVKTAGLWLLTALLIPAVKAVPGGIGSGVAGWAVQRWLRNREKQREPAAKK